MASWFDKTVDAVERLGTVGTKGYAEVTKAQADKIQAQTNANAVGASAQAKQYLAQNSSKIFIAVGLVVGIFAILFLIKMFKK